MERRAEGREGGELVRLNAEVLPRGEELGPFLAVEEVGEASDDGARDVGFVVEHVPEGVDEVGGGEFGAAVASDWGVRGSQWKWGRGREGGEITNRRP